MHKVGVSGLCLLIDHAYEHIMHIMYIFMCVGGCVVFIMLCKCAFG